MYAINIITEALVGKTVDLFYTFSKVSGFSYSLYENRHNLTCKKVVKSVEFIKDYDWQYWELTFDDGTKCHMENDKTC